MWPATMDAAAMEVLSIVGFHEDVVFDEIGRSESYLVLKRNDPGLLWLAKSSLEMSVASVAISCDEKCRLFYFPYQNLDQTRLQTTIQSKIRVYESGQSEQDHDPDLPPELAAAAGLHDASTENANLGKTDGGQRDVIGQGRIAPRIRPPLPTGRAIQIESGYGRHGGFGGEGSNQCSRGMCLVR